MRTLVLLGLLLVACRTSDPPPASAGSTSEGGEAFWIEGAGSDTFLIVGAVPLPLAYLDGIAGQLAHAGVVIRWTPPVGSPEDHLAALERLADALALGRPIVVGHQSGAITALRYAATRPRRTRALVVVSPTYVSAAWNHPAAFLPYDTVRRQGFLQAYRAGLDTLEPRRFCREWWGFLFSPREVPEDVANKLAPAVCGDAPPLRDWLRARRQFYVGLENWDERAVVDAVEVPFLVLESSGEEFADSAAMAWARGRTTLRLVPGPSFAPWLEGGSVDTIIAFAGRSATVVR